MSDDDSELYAVVAVRKGASVASSKRTTLDDETTCYYLVTYMYNVRTGEVVAILDVTFEGCDSGGLAGDGSGGGGGTNVDPPANAGCSDRDKTAGKAYAGIGGANPVFNNPPPNSNGQEMYGYVYQNGTSYAYDSPTTVNLASGHDAFIPQPNVFPGWTPVGLYHTHPHQPDVETSQIDVETGNHFSQFDIDTANGDGYPIYVGVLDTLQRDSSSESPAVRWYKYDPTTHQETMMNLVGSGGC